MSKVILLALVVLALTGCTDPEGATRTLENSGFTDIQLGGWSAFSCGKDDNYSTAFTATNPQGKRVSGTVCCGVLKSCTVRF